MNNVKIPLTIYIRTHNEEKRIGPVLEKALKTGAEVIIIDDGSKDKTVDIAKKLKVNVVETTWHGRGKQKRIAEDKATNKWLLDIDADEILSDELIEELKKIFTNPPSPCLYLIKYIIIPPFPEGKIWKFANVDWRCKLYHKDLVRIPNHEAWDQFKIPKGIYPIKLKNPIYHYSFFNIEHEVNKMNRASSDRANANKLKPKLWLILRILFGYPIYFSKKYLKQKMFTEGLYGFICASVIASNRWLKDVKMYEKYLEKKGINSISKNYENNAS